MVYCETCGQNNTSEAKFCRYCRTTIGKSEYVPNHQNPSSSNSESIGFGSRSTGDHLVMRCSLYRGQDFARDAGRLDSK